jgi:prolyl 4-hydroxylase
MKSLILTFGLLGMSESSRSSSSTTTTTTTTTTALAFASGGFGGGTNSNSKKRKGKQRKGGLSEVSPPSTRPQVVVVVDDNKNKLDKWGLPYATEDDLFPPMPPGTELIPTEDSSIEYSLEDIENCLKDHIDLQLGRFFDESGVAKGSDGKDDPIMKLNLLHKSPPVLAIDNFLTMEECSSIKAAADSAHQVNSATFSGALSTRTSTSWFCRYPDVPLLLAKANQLLNIPLETMEEPQLVRYRKGQEFSWHYDEVPKPQLQNGGQRLATLIVYLSDISAGCGGGTMFRDLPSSSSEDSSTSKPLTMQPKCGSALLFFPAFRDGRPDDRTLHRSEVMDCDDEKWIVQMWVHETPYQAVIPLGNSNEAARDGMDQTSRDLGYIS